MAYANLPYTPKPITDIFTADTDIDRRKCERVVPMRVLALGLGRTGTASLRTALKELGFDDCYHMMSASVENPPDCLMWQDAFAAKYDGVGKFGREEWDKLLGHCQAVCDWPAVAFAKELIEAYPEAKVLVTTRNVDTWHASTLKTVDWRANDPELKMVSRFDWGSGLYQPMLRKFWDVFFGGDFEKNGKQRYIDYYEEIRSLVPKENLLEYRMGEGWEPLCDFLEVPVPEGKKFPHTNDTDGFVDRCRARNRAQMMNVAFRALVVGGSVAATAFSAAMTIRRFVGSRGSLLA
ncbi:hypothetical protein D6C84_05362 [Aureobasidium pullulans]|uniref:NAD dependent epimerase/dehydratase n=2 Tax=Aureobasidium pullulans TaxID=5580 RepID=A0A074Y1K2_AURPU|nr:uncharacterized protein M438DRAFT_393675 [Aureobasidium pullulans EXF-150]OBW68759.1 MAG: Alkaline phosphatase-like protein [Aureobasidium pullulans]KEQ89814.1 hypothetical protein M438DRAFT_393675 [Aureobasidium pullulans EXF-150]THV76822.1 hypothetical protein D6D28_00829 [Aureobasidium pullulans]THV81819.1 hypothetical protein D6D29_05094 [Aureobasidium pullulans]THV97055.1 hypothetical protein D6D27_02321 [Aureobasidium pullulans]